MLKSSVFIIMGLVFGFILAGLYHNSFSSLQSAEQQIALVTEQPVASNIGDSSVVANPQVSEIKKISSKKSVEAMSTAKTPYEIFSALATLDSASAKELQDYLMTIGRDQTTLRTQVAWLLGGKYPKEAFNQINTLMNDGDVELAKTVLQSLGQNHAKMTWDWVKANEKELDNMFKIPAEKNEFKFATLNMLARSPEQKWIAYEAAQTLVDNNQQRGNKFQLLTIAQNAAESDPEDAINYSISGANGKRDTILFNGAINSMADKDATRAKDLALQNQDIIERGTVSLIATKLMQNNRMNDAFQFANSFTNPELGRMAFNAMSYNVALQGVERAKEFAHMIPKEDMRYDLVKSMARVMASNGQSVKDQLALLDAGMDKAATEKKSTDYAYAMRNWPKTDANAFNNYMIELRSRDKTLADSVEEKIKSFQRNN